MKALAKPPEVKRAPSESEVRSVPRSRHMLALDVAAILCSLLSMAVPIAIMVLGSVRHYEEFHFVDGRWVSDTWPAYVALGFFISVGFALTGITLKRWWLRSSIGFSIVALVVTLLLDLLMWLQSMLYLVSM